MDKSVEIGNVKLTLDHAGYFLTITHQLHGVPVEATWVLTEEELRELYAVLLVLTAEEQGAMYEKLQSR